MKLIPLDQIEVFAAPVCPDNDCEIARSRIVYQNKTTPSLINGVVLEAAVEAEKGILLFLTSDVPNEEILDIYFLNHAMKPLDHVVIGRPYRTGCFEYLQLESSQTVSFCFMQNAPWRLTVLNRRRLCLPFFSKPAWTFRWLRCWSFMKLELADD